MTNNLPSIAIFAVKGGLGNQLFCLSKSICTKRSDPSLRIFFDTSLLHKAKTPRTFYEQLFKSVHPYLISITSSYISQAIKLLAILKVINYHTDTSEAFGLFTNITYYNGYFQSAHEAAHATSVIDDAIRNVMRLTTLTDQLTAPAKHSICVHFRVGDYALYPDIYKILPASYFEEGISYLSSFFPSPPAISGFGDSTCQQYLSSSEYLKNELQKITYHPDPLYQLYHMSLFSSIIISNSTFSWWSACLGVSRGNIKKVVLPSSLNASLLASPMFNSNSFIIHV